MVCGSCGRESYCLKVYYTSNGTRESCRYCGDFRVPFTPDVYFDGPYFEANFATPDKPQGQWVESRKHKASILQSLGCREAGDRQHGARNESHVKHQDRSSGRG